jgi:propanediol dehydratase small subunit
MPSEETRTLSGRKFDELRIEAVLSGDLQLEDFRISPETLHRQARIARNAGYPQFAENLLRAAELTRLSNEELLEIYGKLRPGRPMQRWSPSPSAWRKTSTPLERPHS